MPGVFICYRREDSGGYTGRLYDILCLRFGKDNVYMDLDTIEGGDDFIDVIDEKLKLCDVLIAVIGSRWLTATEKKDGTRRLDSASDFVRREISRALTRSIRVIPVLVGGAAMPRAEDLPDELRELSERQAMDIRDAHFHPDTQQLIRVLSSSVTTSGFGRFRTGRSKVLAALVGVVAMAAIPSGYLLLHRASPVQARPPVVELGGKWVAVVKYDWGDTYTNTFEIRVDGSRVTGMAGFAADRDGNGRSILDGKVAGPRITFMTKSLVVSGSEQPLSEERHYYEGTVDGGIIQFTMVTDSIISSHTPVQFIARKVAP